MKRQPSRLFNQQRTQENLNPRLRRYRREAFPLAGQMNNGNGMGMNTSRAPMEMDNNDLGKHTSRRGH
jgi:hypothetical protein